MCGIAGWIGELDAPGRAAEELFRRLRHRGPDARGCRSFPGATLLHTRLAILDLSPAGAEPIGGEGDRVSVVFNGEIYNHRSLRPGLEARGHVFRGHCDAEVLPHLYEEEGPAMLERLRGMFAFAVWDDRARRLLLARDRFGIKPLFYAPLEGGRGLAFASEIRALRALEGIDTAPDLQAALDLAALLYVPAPATFFRGIRAVEPGEAVEAEWDGSRVRVRTHRWHRWTIAPTPPASRAEAVERCDELVMQAVARQLESDVPLGSLLSGGIDSSLVTTAAAARAPGLETFSVQFPDAEFDETRAAVAVARRAGTVHNTIDFRGEDGGIESVANLLDHAGQPFADTSIFAVHAIAKRMRLHVTVALSGDGGDEAFGGYDLFWQLPAIARFARLPGPVARTAMTAVEAFATAGLVRPTLPARLAEVSDGAAEDEAALVATLSTWLRPREHAALVGSQDVLPVRRIFEKRWEHRLPEGSGELERLSAHATETAIRVTLPNDYLFKVDAASMLQSLEVRVPLLDEDLVEFGLTLPHEWKVRGRRGKRLLREVARRRLPGSISRRAKRGFGVPMDVWMTPAARAGLASEVLASSPLADLYREEVYAPWVRAFAKGEYVDGISRQSLFQRAILLFSVSRALSGAA
jgi:asparagine synthase (glutamine-hydrolysing)